MCHLEASNMGSSWLGEAYSHSNDMRLVDSEDKSQLEILFTWRMPGQKINITEAINHKLIFDQREIFFLSYLGHLSCTNGINVPNMAAESYRPVSTVLRFW
jgi:hypothetical protein